MTRDLRSLSRDELAQLVSEHGWDSYRATQIFQWLWQKDVGALDEMTNLSREMRRELAAAYHLAEPAVRERKDARDGTSKFAFVLEDGMVVESVVIPDADRLTICVSSQVGCALGCKFCATALLGFKRNLGFHEICGQVRGARKLYGAAFTNVVLMGMGEPLLNLDAVLETVFVMSSEIGMAISQRHITVSTAGVIEGIERLLQAPVKVKLAVSLNFPDDDLRRRYMPVAYTNPLADLLRVCRRYSEARHPVTFEYVMLADINDSLDHARALVARLRGIPCKVNLIPFNPHPSLPLHPPSPERVQAFFEYLLKSAHTVTVRKSHGQEILGGCGQLAGN